MPLVSGPQGLTLRIASLAADSAFVSAFCAANGIPVSATGAFWYFVNQAIQTVGYGELSYNDLLAISIRFNDAFNDNSGGVWEAIFQNCRAFITNSIALCFGLSEVNFVVEEWGTSGFYRIRETKTGLWVVKSSGQYPCAAANTSGVESGGNKWVGEATVSNNIGSSGKVRILDYSSLSSLNALIINSGINSQLRKLGNNYYGIWYNRQYYCDSKAGSSSAGCRVRLCYKNAPEVSSMFEVLYLLFSWLPSPLDKLVFGAFCILLVFVLVKLISAIIDMIPFL